MTHWMYWIITSIIPKSAWSLLVIPMGFIYQWLYDLCKCHMLNKILSLGMCCWPTYIQDWKNIDVSCEMETIHLQIIIIVEYLFIFISYFILPTSHKEGLYINIYKDWGNKIEEYCMERPINFNLEMKSNESQYC